MFPPTFPRKPGSDPGRLIVTGRRDGVTLLTDTVVVRSSPDGVTLETSQAFGPVARVAQQVRWDLDLHWQPRSILVTLAQGALAEFVYGDEVVEICVSAQGETRRTREPLAHPRSMCLIQNTLHWPLILSQWLTESAAEFATVPPGLLSVSAAEPYGSGTRRRVSLAVRNGPADLVSVCFSSSGVLERFSSETTALDAIVEAPHAEFAH